MAVMAAPWPAAAVPGIPALPGQTPQPLRGRLHSPPVRAKHGVGTLLGRVTAIRRDRAMRHGPVAGRDCSLACRPSRASTGPDVPYGGLEPMAAKLIAFDEEARR